MWSVTSDLTELALSTFECQVYGAFRPIQGRPGTGPTIIAADHRVDARPVGAHGGIISRAEKRHHGPWASFRFLNSRGCWSATVPVCPGTVRFVRSRDYGRDVLAGDWRRPRRGQIPVVAAEPGLVVEDASGRFCGAVVLCEKSAVTLEDRFGKRRVFPLSQAGFLLEGKPVTLVRPGSAPASSSGDAAGPTGSPSASSRAPRTATRRRSASGSIAVEGLSARVARASRIYVEGVHDAELVEKIWGHDLRVEGVVVEYLEGIDDLPAVVAEFGPGPGRRLGVLVDHLVPGSKESRIAAKVTSPHVLVTGHPFVDIWAAVRPSVLGLRAWPDIPRDIPWKEGVISALGWDHDVGAAWKRILAAVHTYTDLEPALLGRVEELIDFVTAPGPEGEASGRRADS